MVQGRIVKELIILAERKLEPGKQYGIRLEDKILTGTYIGECIMPAIRPCIILSEYEKDDKKQLILLEFNKYEKDIKNGIKIPDVQETILCTDLEGRIPGYDSKTRKEEIIIKPEYKHQYKIFMGDDIVTDGVFIGRSNTEEANPYKCVIMSENDYTKSPRLIGFDHHICTTQDKLIILRHRNVEPNDLEKRFMYSKYVPKE